MHHRRLALLALSASLLLSGPAFADSRSLGEILGFKKPAAQEQDMAAPKSKKLQAADAKAKKNKLADADVIAPKKKKNGKLASAEQPASRKGKLLPGVTMGVEPVDASPVEVIASGNNGELRSENTPRKVSLLSGLFGAKPAEPQMLPQTRALDAVLAEKDARKKFKVKDAFIPQEVEFSGYKPGTIVIDTKARYLYLVESSSIARRYAIAVGKQGLQFKGNVTVGDKQEWPRWIPTKEMQQRDPKKYGPHKDGMAGGADNPLGARAIYLYQGRTDTHLRIHGTNQPQTIGTSASNGCFRMVNEHVMDLYRRVKTGTNVVVL